MTTYLTAGHGNRSIDEFVALLKEAAIVVHLVNAGSSRVHRPNPVARLRDGKLVYDGATQDDLKFK